MNWIREALTDSHGEFDVAQIMIPIAITGMLVLQGWAIGKGQEFKAQDLGIGIGAIIGALGAYKWGDSKVPRP